MCRANLTVPVLVEGRRDREALVAVGLEGNIEILNNGQHMTDRISGLARENSRLIVLTDWDRKGKELFARLCELGRSEGMKVEEDHWRRMGPLVSKEIQVVEDLDMLMAQLRRKCGLE